MANKKVVVAFSGGLDTSYTVMKLTQDGWDVYAACANTGGFSEEQLKKNEENAYKLGAVQYVTLDVTHEYYEKSLKYMIFGNVLRNNCRIDWCGQRPDPFRYDLPRDGSWCGDYHTDPR